MNKMQKAKKLIVSGLLTSAMVISSFAMSMGQGITSSAEEKKVSNPRVVNGVTVYDAITFGNYWQQDTNKDGSADQKDSKTPIKWRVLSVENNQALLIADQVLDEVRYSDKSSKDWDHTWENSMIRGWLNGFGNGHYRDRDDKEYYSDKKIDFSQPENSFIGTAFSDKEKAAILTSTVENPDNPFTNPEYDDEYGRGGNTTKDKIFLISVAELANEDYGFSNFELPSVPTEYNGFWATTGGEITDGDKLPGGVGWDYNIYDYAKLRTYTPYAVNSMYPDSDTSTIGTHIWCGRTTAYGTPLYMSYDSMVVYESDGSIVHPENDYYFDQGVCPMLRLDLSKDVWNYAGTVTCSKDGLGLNYKKDASGEHVHTWDKGVITVAATSTKEGIKTYTCTGCNETKTESIPKLEGTQDKTPNNTSSENVSNEKKAQVITIGKLPKLTVKKLKKKGKSFNLKASGKGKLTYKNVTKKSLKKYITVNKSGKVTLKKKAKKGTYKIKISAAGNSDYKATSKTVSIKVK